MFSLGWGRWLGAEWRGEYYFFNINKYFFLRGEGVFGWRFKVSWVERRLL